ncbi:MAG: hypothetical protein HY854_25660 [Burkholderiales bacterium]|nr:hypothetical protein [Burkholderiales bacterium]
MKEPPQIPGRFRLIGETILDWAIKAVTDTMLFADGPSKNKGAFGTAAHQELKHKVQSYKPLPGVEVVAEPYFDGNGIEEKADSKGDLGVDVVVKYNKKNIVAFDLKIGKGYSKKGVADRVKRIGTDVIQIRIKVSGK